MRDHAQATLRLAYALSQVLNRVNELIHAKRGVTARRLSWLGRCGPTAVAFDTDGPSWK